MSYHSFFFPTPFARSLNMKDTKEYLKNCHNTALFIFHLPLSISLYRSKRFCLTGGSSHPVYSHNMTPLPTVGILTYAARCSVKIINAVNKDFNVSCNCLPVVVWRSARPIPSRRPTISSVLVKVFHPLVFTTHQDKR